MTFGARPNLAPTLSAIAGALMLLASPAGAQNEPVKSEGLERAQKAADAVFHWIKLNGDKGANRQPTTPAPAPAPAAARKPVAAPVAAAPKTAAPPAPQSAPAPVAAAASPMPTSAPAAVPPEPTPAPMAATVPEPELERTPVVLAAAAPTPVPSAPLAAAARAVEPPPPPAEAADEPLKLLAKVDPTIPRQLQQQSFRNGFAQVQFTVAPDGSVTQAKAIKASHNRLATAAVDAVKQWRFAPIPRAREAAVEVAFNNAQE